MLTREGSGNESIMMSKGQIAVRILGSLLLATGCSGRSVDFQSNSKGGSDGAENGGMGAGGMSASGGSTGYAGGGLGGQTTNFGCTIGNEYGWYQQLTFDRVFNWRMIFGPDFEVVRILNADGNVVFHAETEAEGFPAMRVDDEYDEQGNRIERMLTHTSDFDYSKKPDGPHEFRLKFTHDYDADGLLAVTEGIDALQLERRDYVHDELGRCSEITRSAEQVVSQFETRTYEGERLSGWRIRKGYFTGEDVREYVLEVTHRFDAKGRLVSSEQDGGRGFATADGVPDVIDTHEYGADGSVRVTRLDFAVSPSSANDSAFRGDEYLPVFKLVWTFSAPCAEIFARVPRPRQLSCAFPDRPRVPSYLDLLSQVSSEGLGQSE